MAAVHGDDNRSAIHRQGVFDDQHIRSPDAPDDALSHTPDDAILHRPDAEGPHDDEVIGVRVDIFDEHLEIPAFEGFPLDGDIRLGRFLVYDVEVGVGDDLEPPRDQGVMDLALPFEFVFVVVFLREPGFHLLESLVMHLGGIDVTAHEF